MNTISQYTATVLILEYQRSVVLETSTSITCTVTSHGLDTGDFVVNFTNRASTQLSSERGSRKITVVDDDTFTLNTEISNQTAGDIMYLYHFTDRSDKVKDGTINLNLKAGGKSEASFTMISEFEGE